MTRLYWVKQWKDKSTRIVMIDFMLGVTIKTDITKAKNTYEITIERYELKKVTYPDNNKITITVQQDNQEHTWAFDKHYMQEAEPFQIAEIRHALNGMWIEDEEEEDEE